MLVVLLITAYFIADVLVRKKVDEALQALPPSLHVTYHSLHSHLFNSSLEIGGVDIRFSRDKHVYEATIGQVAAEGIHFFELMRTHRLRLRSLRLDGIEASGEEMRLSLAGSAEFDSVYASDKGEKGFGAMRLSLRKLRCQLPATREMLHLSNMVLDSRKRVFSLDTLRVMPSVDKSEIGRERGYQVDVVEATSEGIEMQGLDVMGLPEHRVVADRLTVRRNHLYVFRDRRLPLEPGIKSLPMESLMELPVSLRIGTVDIGTTDFTYEEFPKDGEKSGTLSIYRMKARLHPLINRPEAGDPAYIALTTEGSLMNSGIVTATTKMPLHKHEPYLVEGAFHDLDVTRLNNPAEHLGQLHLESGMLNSLAFWFEMGDEKATGKIVGEYHDLVVDKLKANGKVAKLKSFALKKLIIPRNKDKSLPEKKRTGKVDYRRDPQRYFSYYLLHALLVGVKSSFSLGFLLPG